MATSRPDLLVVIAYGLLLPRSAARLAAVGLHQPARVAAAALAGRGADPARRARGRRARPASASCRWMRASIRDPCISKRATPIGARETAGELHDRLAALGGAGVARGVAGRVGRNLRAHAAAGGARDAGAEDREGRGAARLARARRGAGAASARIRPVARRRDALERWPPAARVRGRGRGGARAAPGTIVTAGRAGIDVATGDGVLRLRRIQPPSGRAMDAAAYLAAHSLTGVAFVS